MVANARSHIVYLSFDGLLEPLGYSQVARVVMQLARRPAYRFTICSLEKPTDRDEWGPEKALEAELRDHHVRWRRHSWSDGGTALDVARNLRAMKSMVAQVVERDGADLLHARSYVAASVARSIGRREAIPYLFDTRGFWIDERLERQRWFGGAVGEAAARAWEARLYEDAAGAVTLTEAAAQQIRSNHLGPWKARRPVSVIPTCVDYGEFGLGGPGDAGESSKVLDALYRAPLVVGYVGAVNKAYRLEASLRLFDHILARRPQAHLLCLSRNSPALLTHLKRHRFEPSHYTVRSVAHREMPRWLGCVDWGLLLRQGRPSDRAHMAAMPTKLGEFFATGIRPLYWGHNPEVSHWIKRAQSGLVMEDIDEAALRQAADTVATTPRCLHTLWGARWRTQPHFGLEQAVTRYESTYEAILDRCRAPRLKALFLTEGTTVPAARFRVQQLVPHLEARGIECTVRAAYGERYNRWASSPLGPAYKLACRLQRLPYAWDANRFDVLFLQRPALPFSAVGEVVANWRNPHTIFDVDDAIHCAPDGSPDDRRRAVMEAIAARCAHVICGNEYLARQVRSEAATSVIPTVVDTEVYRPAPGGDRSDAVVIGWMGTASNFTSLRTIAPVLRRLAAEPKVVVRIVSNAQFQPLAGVEGVEQRRWQADSEVADLQSFDIGLMPLLENRSTRGKCGFKAIQYMAVGIPVVASPVGVNTRLLGDGGPGVLAPDPPAFERALRQLVADSEQRAAMGRAGWRRVQQHYSVEAVIDRYVELLEAVARRTPVTKGRSMAELVPSIPGRRPSI